MSRKKIDIVNEVKVDDLLTCTEDRRLIEAVSWLIGKQFVQNEYIIIEHKTMLNLSRSFRIDGTVFTITVGLCCDEDENFTGKAVIRAEVNDHSYLNFLEGDIEAMMEDDEASSKLISKIINDGLEHFCKDVEKGVRKMLSELVEIQETIKKYHAEWK